MKLRHVLRVLLAAAVLLGARQAAAAEPEAVRFEVEAAPGCVEEAAVREEIGALGARFRDANLDDRARTFRIEAATAKDGVSGRLVVRDLAFRDTIRELRARSCLEATRSLAFFAATALDEAPPPAALVPSAPASAAPAPWPAPADETNRTLLERAPRLGSGGLTVGGTGGVGTSVSAGFRGSAVWRIGRTTRLGVAGAITHGVRAVNRDSWREESRGLTNRAGALVGWGAPWNDGIVGFATELGVAWGDHRGATFPAVHEGSCEGGFVLSGSAPCFDHSRGAPARWGFVSPYVAPQLVLQVPFKDVPVRPIAAVGLLWAAIGPGGDIVAVTAETGIVWQAW